MGEIIERKCRCCGYVYKYEKYPSYISFCPRCKSHDYTVCHYTKKGITQCKIYLGGKVIGKVISQKNKNYRLSCEMFEINEELIDSFNPYFETEKIVQKRLREYYGHLDLKNGRLFLSDEILEKATPHSCQRMKNVI